MRIPYGYQIKNNAFIICQEKAKVVRMIFDYYLSGASLGKVADKHLCHQLHFGAWRD